MTKKKWIMIGACLVLILLVLGGLSGAMALFTDTETVEASVMVAGSLDIEIKDDHWLSGVGNIQPGDTFTFQFTLRSTGTLPLDYYVKHELSDEYKLAEVCEVSEINIDDGTASLSAASGSDTTDTIEVTVVMLDAGDEYQGESGQLIVTIHATQQP